MELFDTHCHIQSAGMARGEQTTRALWAKAGETDLVAIVDRANAAGVATMLCVGCDLEDSRLAIECAQDRDGIYASIGIHPHEAAKYVGQKGLLDTFSAFAEAPKVVAVGECGLDYYYEHSPKSSQIEILQFQIELALKHNLPVIFHVREAMNDFWPIFDSYQSSTQKIRGVLHSFTDTEENLNKAVDRGLYVGVNGIATFAKQPEQIAMYRAIPLNNLLLETDAPFLTPVPHRGTICEPYHVKVTANFLSTLRGETVEMITQATTQSARQLFNVT